MLDLIRLSPRLLFPPGDVDLYRQIALLTDMDAGDEVLDVAAGKGIPLEYFVREFGVQGSGVEADGRLVDQAAERVRGSDLSERLQFQSGSPAALPYRDSIFDVSVGELGLAADCPPEQAVRELVRVTRPGGHIVLVQLVWKAPVDPGRQHIVSEHLGARPLMLVEWKRLLRESGVEGLHTEDWTDEETAFRAGGVKPFPDFAEIFTLWEKIGILRRAWSRYGWTGVRTILQREREIHRLLSRDRVISLALLTGRTPDAAENDPVEEGEEGESVEDVPEGAGDDAPEGAAVAPAPPDRSPPPSDPAPDEADDTTGLPLFGAETSHER